jgi:hypothetical protein
MENSMEAPQNLKIDLPFNTAIPLLGIYSKECKSGYNKRTMFTAALFTIAKLWEQPRFSTTHEFIKKNVVFIYNGILFSHKEE